MNSVSEETDAVRNSYSLYRYKQHNITVALTMILTYLTLFFYLLSAVYRSETRTCRQEHRDI
jgi:hypothetical protein